MATTKKIRCRMHQNCSLELGGKVYGSRDPVSVTEDEYKAHRSHMSLILVCAEDKCENEVFVPGAVCAACVAKAEKAKETAE